ncbi:hypothetical protein F4801DRAFT_355760 [Xylaria longipes]|nr:hypothetical protein F4801DRAFT_355760 [Xylaria longipes]
MCSLSIVLVNFSLSAMRGFLWDGRAARFDYASSLESGSNVSMKRFTRNILYATNHSADQEALGHKVFFTTRVRFNDL